jgi:hypothetical protein
MLDKHFDVPHGIRRRQVRAGMLEGHGDVHGDQGLIFND